VGNASADEAGKLSIPIEALQVNELLGSPEDAGDVVANVLGAMGSRAPPLT
jgi:hypothetical protein